jgi:hypothetical protein
MSSNEEGSINIESEEFVELSLLWFTLPLVNVEDIELLEDLSVLWFNNDVSVFIISSIVNF